MSLLFFYKQFRVKLTFGGHQFMVGYVYIVWVCVCERERECKIIINIQLVDRNNGEENVG